MAPHADTTLDYRFDKVLEALVYFARTPSLVTNVDKKKVISLLFLSDREFMLKYGRSIFGEQYKAMPWGTVVQHTLDLLDQFEGLQERRTRDVFLRQISDAVQLTTVPAHDYPVYEAKRDARLTALSELELEVIRSVMKTYGRRSFNQLHDPIHPPAWDRAWEKAQRAGKNAWPIQSEELFEGQAATEGALEELRENARIKRALSGRR